MKQALTNLLKIKSLVTVITTLAFVVLLFTKVANAQASTVIYTSIISFYFGVQTTKKEQNGST